MPTSDNRRKKDKRRARGGKVAKQRSNESSNTPTYPDDRAQVSQGMFMAPCGSTVMYMTDAQLPEMKEYRQYAIQDHLAGGDCPSPDVCREALASGEF